MDMKLKEDFLKRWKKYFNSAELPIAFFYSNQTGSSEPVGPPSGHRCFICDLAAVRKGKSLAFDAASVSCGGGKRYLGFTQELMPDFEYFLSCGIEGKLEGERYIKSPEMVKVLMEKMPVFKAPGRYIHFKRWDMLEQADEPEAVIFFAGADVLSGLFTLANFDRDDAAGVSAPFGSGCSSIVYYPLRERKAEKPRAVLGMFDVSARPSETDNLLTFAVPFEKFSTMVANMDESFLITGSWAKVRRRLK